MRKYLYLTEVEWANAWIDGGEIPILLASNYLRDVRDRTYTPDENLIYQSAIPISTLKENGLDISQCKDMVFKNCTFGDLRIDHLEFSHYTDDGLILSFSNSYSEVIARKLGKKACIRINKILALKACIDEQLSCESKMGYCLYTNDHQRNHFLKSSEDSWQDEYRIFWQLNSNKMVRIPKGTASFVSEFSSC